MLKGRNGQTEAGSAPVETVFAMGILLFLVLAVIEVAFALYGRNVVHASAHEGARAAVELGRDPNDAARVATEVVRGSASGLVDDLDVSVAVEEAGPRSIVQVRVRATLKSFGPVPMPIPVAAVATIARPADPL